MSRRTDVVSKLRVTGISRRTVLLGSFAPAVLVAVVMALFGVGLDRTLAVAGTVLAIATFALSQWQAEGPRARRAVMIPKSRSPFSSSVHRGLADAIASYPEISLSVKWPEAPQADQTEWQASLLRSPEVIRADALVIIPAGDDERIWRELVRISRAGVFVVVVDTKPENAYFAGRQAPRPCFVGSDFRSGGEIVGNEIVRWVDTNRASRAIVTVGPEWSYPGSERSRGVAHALCVGGIAGRTTFVPILDWDRDRVTELLGDALRCALDEMGDERAPLVVFCGNDKIADALERFVLRSVSAEWHDLVRLVGYDGAIAADGQLMLRACDLAAATIDTRPGEQGAVAADVLIDEHRGLLNGRSSRYIAPRLVSFRAAGEIGAAG